MEVMKYTVPHANE